MSEVPPPPEPVRTVQETPVVREASPRDVPARRPTALGRLLAVLGLGAATVYLLNPTLGLFELLPDNLPGVGNLDEAAAAGLVLLCLRYLGLDILGPRRPRE